MSSMTDDAWRPIPFVRLDLDAPAQPDSLLNAARARVEVERGGQIVGVMEASVVDGHWSSNTIEDATKRFEDVKVDRGRVDDDQLPSISVVVPTICVEPAQLMRTVDSLLALDYPRFDILVVDNRTDARTPLPSFSDAERVRCVSELRPGISAARNRGIAEASGDVVAFTDDDVSVDAGWLRAIGTSFALHPEVEGVGGLVMPRELDTQPQLWFEEFFGGFSHSFQASLMSNELSRESDPMFPYSPGRFGAGCNMAFRRTSLERVGGFNLALGTGTLSKGGEDLAMFLALALGGATLAFEPAALVRHSHRYTEAAFLKQVFGYGAGLTAMYSAFVAAHPRELAHIVARMPRAYRQLTRSPAERYSSTEPTYPRSCRVRQLLGMAYGPIAYARSLVAARHYK
jgi:GT2 family glycosyltransferase